MKLFRILVAVALASSAFAQAAPPSFETLAPSLSAKIDATLLRKLAAGSTEEFLIILRKQADVSASARLTTREEKARFVFEQLQQAADATQPDLRDWLSSNGVAHQPFWVANMVLASGDAVIAIRLAARDDVARISANPQVRMALPDPETATPELKAIAAIEWGVSKIRAPEVWSIGNTGQGIVVASADTGIDWTHPALIGKYRGWNGMAATHDYNWHDAIHSFNAVCPANSSEPCDDNRHGTHTVGTMVGDDGAGNQVGVAPGAKWIGCRNMDQGKGTPASYAECFQFFLAPTTMAGLNPDPSKAPDVINNSWDCPPSEGCTDPLILKTIVENLKAAGIVVVAAATNSGPSCQTVSGPPAIYDATFTIGATDSADLIATFSSRGPVIVDGSNRTKPDLSAPGVSVRSTTPGGGYGSFSGTSMATPHVAGAVALLLSARPMLRGNPDALQSLFEHTAVPRTSATSCGPIAGNAIPNNIYGWGRLDVKAALDGVPVPSLDVDASGKPTQYDALTDGLIIVRYLFGIRGPALVAGATGRTATRTSSAAIASYLDSIRSALDVDGNGAVDALTDGLLIVRYLFGLRGAGLSDGAVSSGAARPTAALIEDYLRTLIP